MQTLITDTNQFDVLSQSNFEAILVLHGRLSERVPLKLGLQEVTVNQNNTNMVLRSLPAHQGSCETLKHQRKPLTMYMVGEP